MGTYVCNAEEIADAMEDCNVDGAIEGDFYEDDFIKAAKLYVERLRENGVYIFKDGGRHNCSNCGRIIKKGELCKKCKKVI